MTYYREDFLSADAKPTFMLKKHQINGLIESNRYTGVIAGFVLNFRKHSRTYFLGIDDFNDMASRLDKKSFNEDDVVRAGGILIAQTLKKTNYDFDVAGFIGDMKNIKSEEIKANAKSIH